jgi:hypothetical protein
MDHFITTLRQLYSIKINNWEGTNYIGMDININRKKGPVTISMPGYIDKLLQSIRRNGMKAASTSATYCPSNFENPGAQTATIDDTPEASKEQKHEIHKYARQSTPLALYKQNRRLRTCKNGTTTSIPVYS